MSTVITPSSPPVPILPVDPQSPPAEAIKQKQEKRKAYPALLEFLNNTCKQVEEQDKSDGLNILGQQNRCQAFYDDRQYGKVNERTGDWEENKYSPGEFTPKDNRYKEQIDKLLMEAVRSYTELNTEPSDQNDSTMQEMAAYAKFRLEVNRKRLFIQRPEFRESEFMSLFLKTLTYRYTYFDKNAEEGPTEQRSSFSDTALGETKSLTVCQVCGRKREAEGPCSTCGSTSSREMTTNPVTVPLPSGTEEVKSGLPRVVHADPSMVQVSLNARMMDISLSPFLVWIQMIELGKLERMFPDKMIPSGDDETDRQAQTRRENETTVSNSPYESTSGQVHGGEQFKPRKLKLIWLDRWIYDDYSYSQPQKLPNGQELPANTPLGPFFTKGMCLAKVGNTILMFWNEDKNKKWSVCVYGIREHAFHGAGTNALIPLQVQHLDLLAYRQKNAYDNTAPREFIRQDAISGENLPRIDTVAVVTNLDEGQRIVGNVYDRAPGTPLPPEVPQLDEEMRGAMRDQAGTSGLSPVGTDAEQAATKTATAVAYMRDQQVGRMGPNLMLHAAMEVETAFQLLECEQANYSRQTLMKFAGLQPKAVGNLGYTARGVDAFINCNLRQALNITPAPGSWMPATEQERKADALAFADASSKVADPQTLSHLAKVLKQPTQIGGVNGTQREAERRIEEFAKVIQIMAARGFTEPTDEMGEAVLNSARGAQISQVMDDHPAFIGYYKDWYVSDEAQNSPPLLKKTVERVVVRHKDAMTTEVADANARTLETQVPEQLASMATSALQQGGEPEANETDGEVEKQTAMNQLNQEDREHAALTSVQQKSAEAQIKQRDREHQAKTSRVATQTQE